MYSSFLNNSLFTNWIHLQEIDVAPGSSVRPDGYTEGCPVTCPQGPPGLNGTDVILCRFNVNIKNWVTCSSQGLPGLPGADGERGPMGPPGPILSGDNDNGLNEDDIRNICAVVVEGLINIFHRIISDNQSTSSYRKIGSSLRHFGGSSWSPRKM